MSPLRLLGIVLEVGNSLNHGTSKGGAKGIQLSSLMKLTQTRTNSGATLLEYIVVHLQNKSPDLLKLSDDLHSIDLATKVALESVRQDVNKMNIGCRQISTGIDLDAKDNCPIFEQAMAPFLAQVQVMRDEAVRTIEQVDVEFAALCSYFAAPPPPTTSPDEFFALVSNFAHTFTTTVTHVDEKNVRLLFGWGGWEGWCWVVFVCDRCGETWRYNSRLFSLLLFCCCCWYYYCCTGTAKASSVAEQRASKNEN